jgi:hypothetical protein
MKADTKKWIENFEQELINIQIEFDAFFLKGKIDDYYKLKVDETTGKPSIYIAESNELPKQIEEALSDAFIKSEPKK